MRVATMVLGLILMALVGMQSCAVSFGGALGDSNRMEQGGALGILVALLFLVGAAFALAFPIVSLASFTLAGLLGLAGGSTTPFEDLTFWGMASLGLAVLSFLGWREKRKRREEGRSRVV